MSRTRLIETTNDEEEKNNSQPSQTTAQKIMMWPYSFFGGIFGFSRMGETPTATVSTNDNHTVQGQVKPKPPAKARHKRTRSWSYNDLDALLDKQSHSPLDTPSLLSPLGHSLAIMPTPQPDKIAQSRIRRHGDFLRLHPDSSPCLPPTNIPEISVDEISPPTSNHTFMRIEGDSASMPQPAHIPEFLSPETETRLSKSRYLILKS